MALLKTRLSIMMFLEFFIWGAWLPLIFGYLPSLGFNDWQVPLILGLFNLSALLAMFFSNQFVDRNFAAEKFLAFSHFVGGLGILGLAFVKGGWSETLFGIQINMSFWAFMALMAVHTLFYVPTISITNAIAFANMKDSKEFGMIRLWGTIGWIAAAWPFVFVLVDWDRVPSIGQDAALVKTADGSNVGVIPVTAQTQDALQRRAGQKLEETTAVEVSGVKIEPSHKVEIVKTDFWLWLKTALGTAKKDQAFKEATRYTFLAAGLASLLLAAFSMVLPHTPPKPAREGGESLAWLEAMKLLAKPFVFVLFLVTFLDAAIHQSFFYWSATFLEKGVNLPTNWIMPVMSIGQVAEIATMAVLGYVLKAFGWRFTMVIGILGHAGRFAVFAFAQQLPAEYQQPAAITVNVLHGICYAFFFATVYIFIDEYFPKDARASAQGLFNMLILGVGPFVSNFVSGRLAALWARPGEPANFHLIFMVPLGTALVAALLLLLFFHPPKKATAPT